MLLALLNRIASLTGKNALWVSTLHAKIIRSVHQMLWWPIELICTYRNRSKLPPITDARGKSPPTSVDDYWGSHTIWQGPFLKKEQSIAYIQELTDGRPMKRELARLHGGHHGKVIMDYGCGPGNDLSGFAEYSDSAKIIGVDISKRALKMARSRVSWHAKSETEFAFYQVSDGAVSIPLPDNNVDYIQSLGVLMCTTNYRDVLKELARILSPEGEIRVMLYNADSTSIQITIGYEWRLVHGNNPEMTPEELFEDRADLGAPVMKAVRQSDVEKWCEGTGLVPEFLGGYFMPGEIEEYHRLKDAAIKDDRLNPFQRHFLRSITVDANGIPYYNGKPAGQGGMYRLTFL
jgi:ubiquinone/menaquinone biosynthesis C-methylase UbiE